MKRDIFWVKSILMQWSYQFEEKQTILLHSHEDIDKVLFGEKLASETPFRGCHSLI